MRFRKRLTEEELENKIIKLKNWYEPIDLNPAFQNNKMLSIRKLDAILQRSNRQDLQRASINEMLLCALTLLYYFGMRLKLNRSNSIHFPQWCSKRQFLKAETVFQKTMDRLLPERSEATITIMLTFFTDVALWPYENFVRQILEVVIFCTRKESTVLNMLLTEIQFVLFYDAVGARHRMRVLYGLLKSEHLNLEEPTILPFINQLLSSYTNGIFSDSNNLVIYTYLRKGFDVCLRRIFERAHNKYRLSIITNMLQWFASMDIKDGDSLEHSGLVLYAAEVYIIRRLNESLPDKFVVHVLSELVGSKNSLRSLVGCGLMQRFLDRLVNSQYLVEPKLYYEVTKTRLTVGTYNDSDKLFIERHKEKLHECFILALKNHCESGANLRALFTMVCCMILDVPCNLTAAAAAYMMMIVQDFALSGENISPRSRCWMHAIVISVLSLICWVHKAPVLYKYVNQIISRRAKEAPQLNPPLLQEYSEKHLHAWTKTTLFFEDWELKYGLWKAFSVSPGTRKQKLNTTEGEVLGAERQLNKYDNLRTVFEQQTATSQRYHHDTHLAYNKGATFFLKKTRELM